MSNLYQVAATGVAYNTKAYLKSLVLAAGSGAAATAQIRDSASGSIVMSLAAPAASSAKWKSGGKRGVFFGTNVHVTLSGAGATASVEVE